MTDEQTAVEKAQGGDLFDLQLLLLSHVDQLQSRISSEIPLDLRHVLPVEDVVQDVCVEAIRDIAAFQWRGAGSFQQWLNEVARTCLLDLIRTQRRQKRGGDRIGLRLSWLDIADAVTAAGDRPVDQVTPSRIAHSHQVVQAVRLAVVSLPDRERTAMRLYYLEGRSAEDVAEEMQITPGAVRALLQRGRSHLRELLGKSSDWLSSK